MKSVVFTVVLLFGGVANASIMLWLDPAVQSDVATGDEVSLTLMVGGLGDGVPDSLGAFDVDIMFDESLLTFMSYDLFDGLGDIDAFEADDISWGYDGASTINLAEVSYLFDFELDALQSSSFALADIVFQVGALAAGESTTVSLSPLEFSDSSGVSLLVDLGDDAVITAAQTAVSAPASSALLGFSFLLLYLRRQTRTAHTKNLSTTIANC
ncbi:hypothetical protein BFC17_16795 [Alteromonas lipolytica]|uniref:Cohesin domain-containing protein n=2 Tax=Alteromonas lipolytica TaxID=1856405 RepID=A0A1E8FHV5_9ALTE|nr:hypothetical protein BFC17_16795 [Alteromonas lipolytica]